MRNALIIGGGIGGMSTALVLRRQGWSVDVAELDPQWRVYGAGITLTGPSLRAFERLGIYDEMAGRAFAGDGIRVCDVSGEERQLIATPRPALADVAGSGGILRPILHEILARRTMESGARVKLGVTVEAMVQQDDAVEARLSDGTHCRYGLVVGADGLQSKVRRMLFPSAPEPHYLGQYIWRLVWPRPAHIDRRHYFLGGPVKVGLCPVSADEMYLFMLENLAEPCRVPDEQLAGDMARHLASYGDVLADIRTGLIAGAEARIIRRPLEGFLLPAPWHDGRIVLIGDAAHPTTPQLASGAGMATEDALVLGEELAGGGPVPEALERMTQRRYTRCRMVVENSLEIGRRERNGASPESQTELVARSLAVLAEPY